jgi:uncharacterized repeat protein (TIGR01451 family)
MRVLGLRLWVLVALWLVAGGASTGCARHQIPAIDPTGQHIFSGTTTLASHDWLFHRHHDAQPAVAPVAAPAVTVAPIQPPCTPPVAVVPVAPPQPLVAVPLAPAAPAVPVNPICAPQPSIGMPSQVVLPGKSQPAGPVCDPAATADHGPELKITPSRIVAPVGTEVILAAGICSPDGYYITKQPLEWMLAQDGAGQIVAIGHESPHNVSLLLRHSPQKVATNYARAHTSTISQVLDRGTPSPADDVYLNKGQSWITVTSSTEGTSHVVVWAPKEQNWERRKATATVHWVDAAWRFPTPAAARAGARQTLTTVISRANGQPLSGWLVRYEFVEGPPAVFSARGNTAVEVATDAAGRATAELLPQSQEAGITAVRVQIIRPGTARGDLPQMVVGQGMTSVQWTSPGLTVRAMGSSSVTADGAIGYRVEVVNSGDLVTRGAVLSYTPPPGVAVLNSTPSGQQFGQRYEWRLGDLAPRTAAVVELTCRANVTASIRSCFRATSSEQLSAEHCVTTDVRTNAVSVKMTGPEAIEVGREAKFLVEVTNIGQSLVTNITASDTFDPGLAHAGGERSPLVRTLAASLPPGQSHRFELPFVVTQAGLQCHRLDVTADGGHAAAARACVTGIQPAVAPPQLSVRVNGPPNRQAGETAEYLVQLQNTGGTPASNVVITVTWGINLELDQATRDHEDDLPRRTTRWRISQLAGGQTISRQLIVRCLNADEQGAVVRATVTSQQTTAVSSQAATLIAPGTARAAPSPTAPDSRLPTPDSRAPSFRISVGALSNPVVVGATTTFVVNVANDRAVSDRDVTVSAQVVGDGLAIVRMGGPSAVLRSAPDSVDFTPIREVRAGEPLPPYRIEVRGVRPGAQKIRVTVISAGAPAGVVAEGEVTVNMQ